MTKVYTGTRFTLPSLTLAGIGSVASTGALADNLGMLVSDGHYTPEQISLFIPVTGTVDYATTATCRYKKSSDISWTAAHPLYRIRPDYTDEAPRIEEGFAWPIIDLEQGTEYDVEVTLDDGVDNVVKTLTHTTRALPPAAGAATVNLNSGMSQATIVAALNALVPGDVCVFADGTYDVVDYYSTTNLHGTEEVPIYIRGESRDGVIFTINQFLNFRNNCGDIIWENFTIEGPGVDGQPLPVARAFVSHDAAVTTRLTVRNITATGIDQFFINESDGYGCLTYQNDVTGNNLWEATPVDWIGTSLSYRGWNDDGINLQGNGNCSFENTMEGFGDTLTWCAPNDRDNTSAVKACFHYRNKVRNGVDDGTEVDQAFRNLGFYDNHSTNTMTALSLDPLNAGPLLFCRNIFINQGRTIMKWNSKQSGMFIYSNTFISTTKQYETQDPGSAVESLWYQPSNGTQRNYGWRNNICVYRGVGDYIIRMDAGGHEFIDFDHNSWYPDRLINMGSSSATNLADAQANFPDRTPLYSGYTRQFQNDVITTSNPFTDTVTLGADYLTEVTAHYLPIPDPGSTEKNSGVAIPNVTDGYSGAAPDRGAIIEGRATVSYGSTILPAWLENKPLNEFFQISGTSGAGGSSVIDYSGMALKLSNSEIIIGAAGGHTHSDNRVTSMVLEVNSPSWALRKAPSTPTADVDYNGDGTPTSRHLYSHIHHIADRDVVVLAGCKFGYGPGTPQNGFMDAFSLATNTWDTTTLTDFDASTYGFGVFLDLLTGDIWTHALKKWTNATNTWSSPIVTRTSEPIRYPFAHDTLRNQIFTLQGGDGGDGSTSPVYATRIPLGGTQQFTVSFNASAGLTALGARSNLVYSGLIYNPDRDVFYFCNDNGTDVALFTITPNGTSTWDVAEFTFGAGNDMPLSSGGNGIHSRIKYVPNLKGIVVLSVPADNLYFMRTP